MQIYYKYREEGAGMELIEQLKKAPWFTDLLKVIGKVLPMPDMSPDRDGLCSVSYSDKTLLLVYARQELNQRYAIEVVESLKNVEEKNLAEALSTLVEANQLQGVSCNWVLHPGQYQLLQLQDVNVPDAELKLAVRWQIKELIDYPVESAAIDAFRIPPHGPGKRRQMVYVVAAKMASLQPIASAIYTANLRLKYIDINELALRNIGLLFPEASAKGLMLLNLKENNGDVLIMQGGSVFLVRQIDKKITDLLRVDDGQRFLTEGLAMEIKRSYDYYLTQLAQPNLATFFVSPPALAGTQILESLQRLFDFPIEVLDLNKELMFKTPLTSEMQSLFLSTIGGSLRQEDNIKAIATETEKVNAE